MQDDTRASLVTLTYKMFSCNFLLNRVLLPIADLEANK